jgi:hypothetical protein
VRNIYKDVRFLWPKNLTLGSPATGAGAGAGAGKAAY